MSKLAVHVQHFKSGAVGSLASHSWYKRGEHDQHSNQDIDTTRSKENMALVLPGKSLYQDVKAMVEASTGRVTAASIWVSEWIIYPPEDLQDPRTAPKDEVERYYRDVLAWMKGEGFVVPMATIHFDESTIHAHIDTVPLTQDGRLSRKEVYTRARLGQIHTDLAEYLADRGWNIQRGESTKDKQVRAKTVPEYKKEAEAAKQAALAERDAALAARDAALAERDAALTDRDAALERCAATEKSAMRLLESSRLPDELAKIQPKQALDGTVKLKPADYQALWDTAKAARLAIDQVVLATDLADAKEEALEREQLARARAERDLEAAMRLRVAWELERSVLFQLIRLAVLMINRDAGLAMDFRNELYKESTKTVELGRMNWKVQEMIDQVCGTTYAAEDKARYFAAHPEKNPYCY